MVGIGPPKMIPTSHQSLQHLIILQKIMSIKWQHDISRKYKNFIDFVSVTSATLGRNISAICYIAADFGSSMSEDRFIALILLHFYTYIASNYNKIAEMHTRK